MILGRVIGEIWSTQKSSRLQEQKLLMIKPFGWYNPGLDSDLIVAVDSLDAGPGDNVVVCLGTPARLKSGGRHIPVDAAVQAVVDEINMDQGG